MAKKVKVAFGVPDVPNMPINVTKHEHLPEATEAGQRAWLNGHPMHAVRNVMYGGFVWESVNTPYSCSVSSESYWCN